MVIQSLFKSSRNQRAVGPTAFLPRYTGGAIFFHWATFLLVVAVGALGFLRDSWSNRHEQAFWINIHALLGLLLWLVVIIRLWWRKRHSPPAPPESFDTRTQSIAKTVHVFLYLLLLITPVMGVVTFVYHGRIFDFGFFGIDLGIAQDRAIYHPTQNVHGYLAYAIFALVSFHALAALWHQFYLRDGLLRRMWPAREASR